MFTDNQMAVLRILLEDPDRAFTMSELGRLLGKAPGVFQRGLNALEEDGFIISQREANLRMLKLSPAGPLRKALSTLVRHSGQPLPPDVHMTYRLPDAHSVPRVAEPPEIYATSALKILIIGGPNGAGKTTFAREFLPREGQCQIFINADYLAHGLSPFSPDSVALKAGRLVLRELDEHILHRRNAAIETTLSGRRYARLIPQWQEQGYAVKLIFLSLPSVELALARVAGRVRQGGHAIPEETIRRRFGTGRKHFDEIYKPLVDAWALYDNSGDQPILLDEEEK